MRRKLIKQGINGLTIYLPQKWIKERNLEGGEEILIEPFEDKLIISTEKVINKKSIEITLEDESKEFIRNYLNQLYRLGFDSIKVSSSHKEKLLLCEKFSSMFLLGFEVIESRKNQIVLENVSEPSEEKESSILRRIFLIVQESYDLLENGKESKEEINRLTRKVTQFDNFLRRNLAKQNLAYGKQFFNWEFYNYLLLVQHSFFHIVESCKTFPKQFTTDLSLLKDNFLEIYASYFKNDISGIDKAQYTANTILESLQKKHSSHLSHHYLLELSRLQYLLCIPILSLLQSLKEIEPNSLQTP